MIDGQKMADLAERILRYTDARDGIGPFETAIDGLAILRSDHPKRPNHQIFRPALCLTVQGLKSTTVGGNRFDYGAGQALVVGVEQPAIGRIAVASSEKPYLGIVVELDLGVLREIIEEIAPPSIATGEAGRGVFITDFDGALLDCAARAIQLLQMPRAVLTLYPGIMREICYWLLTGPNGDDIARTAFATARSQRVLGAIHHLRDRFVEPIAIEELATIAHMSVSAFHRQFKSLTCMTPLQYQKQLRLLEARRVMTESGAKAETAAHVVGYESASQFSREYVRMFGLSPARHTAAAREQMQRGPAVMPR